MITEFKKLKNSATAFVWPFILVVCLCCAVLACERQKADPHAIGEDAAIVETIRITPRDVVLEVGQTQQFYAVLGDEAGNMLLERMATPSVMVGSKKQLTATIGDSMGRTGRVLTWSSNQPSKVSIDSSGFMTALSSGTAIIMAKSEGHSSAVKVKIKKPTREPLTVVPESASISVGETLQLKAIMQDNNGKMLNGLITWTSVKSSQATVTENGIVKPIIAGTTTITASSAGESGKAVIMITPSSTIHGLDFPGSAGVNKTMRFEFTSPLEAYPATYIWRVYPRQQQSYYTAFFWGNNGPVFPSRTYYGFHPYPDWKTTHQHFWEIAATPGGDFVNSTHVVYNRWYIQVAVCEKSDGKNIQEFYWDWPDVTKVIRHTNELSEDPPSPGLVVGDAPWNQGNEVWDGVIRGFQFYDAALTKSEIKQEVASPGSMRKPWYLNLNPTPVDISDKSGSGHYPAWVGSERPSLWTGTVIGDTIINSTVSLQ